MPEQETNRTVTIQEVYEEILKSRKELRNIVEASEAKILLKLENLQHRIGQLEKENSHLKQKIEVLERNEKKRNIIIFGLSRQEIISADAVCLKIKTLLNIDVSVSDISNYYFLGKATNSPLKVEFVTGLKQKEIIDNTKSLRGTSVSIRKDLTVKQREEFRTLKSHLQIFRENTNKKCYIKQNKLYIDNVPHTVEDLETLMSDEEDNAKPSSAPPTPNVRSLEREFLRNKEEKRREGVPSCSDKIQQNVDENTSIKAGSATRNTSETPKAAQKLIKSSDIASKIRTRSTNK